jgi:hypothetical protein
MEKTEDYDLISLNPIIKSIWKSSKQIPSKIIKTPGISKNSSPKPLAFSRTSDNQL